jgi:hypothetical protein
VAVIGLDNAVVVETKGAPLVSKKTDVLKVKNIVNPLKSKKEVSLSLTVKFIVPGGNVFQLIMVNDSKSNVLR